MGLGFFVVFPSPLPAGWADMCVRKWPCPLHRTRKALQRSPPEEVREQLIRVRQIAMEVEKLRSELAFSGTTHQPPSRGRTSVFGVHVWGQVRGIDLTVTRLLSERLRDVQGKQEDLHAEVSKLHRLEWKYLTQSPDVLPEEKCLDTDW